MKHAGIVLSQGSLFDPSSDVVFWCWGMFIGESEQNNVYSRMAGPGKELGMVEVVGGAQRDAGRSLGGRGAHFECLTLNRAAMDLDV